jgi:hypothetical protein
MRKLPEGRPLGRAERVSLGSEVVVAYALVRRELRRASIEKVVERLRVPGEWPTVEATHVELEEARRLGRAVVRTLRFLPGDTRCLLRSLVLLRLLARRGIEARLVIGARTGPDFLAHAWIEYDGLPVLSPLNDSFGRLVEL